MGCCEKSEKFASKNQNRAARLKPTYNKCALKITDCQDHSLFAAYKIVGKVANNRLLS